MDRRLFTAILLVLGLVSFTEASNKQIEEVKEDFVELVRAKTLLERILDYSGVEKRGHLDSCKSNPCQNGAQCTHTPAEFRTRLGLDYSCLCHGDFGGFFCEIRRPCDTCPENARFCQRTMKDQTGRYCYNSQYQIVV